MTASARAARPVRRACFLSDLHLRGDDPAGVARAVDFVAHGRRLGADALFLLGDVYLAWMGRRSLDDPGLAPFRDALAAAAEAGVRVVLVHGNHDFLLGREVERALGVEVAPSGLEVSLGGQRARLVHGDVFCTADRAYHRLHAVLRSPAVRACVEALPVRASGALRDALLSAAKRSTARKTDEIMGLVDAAILAALAAGPDLIVCGHVHRPSDRRFVVDGRPGRLVVLADFERTGSHALWADGRLELAPRDARFAPRSGPVLAIDGPAGSGKSAVSRAVAARLGWGHLDSGALYRAVTAATLRLGTAPPPGALGRAARELCLDVDEHGRVLAEGRVVPDGTLRSAEVSAQVSRVSADPEVRAALLDVQRGAARRHRGLVAEGRDMTTVVFPDAVARIYLDARPEVRAGRRARQAGESAAEGLAALHERDRKDSSRAVAPLVLGAGVARVDTSDLGLEAVVEAVLARLPAGGF
ncbi:MAG TPA: (d)CMP kinase [Planctomycetota bacterium]|nr:(d)CMP kinase [Planctomycetota bacterium]